MNINMGRPRRKKEDIKKSKKIIYENGNMYRVYSYPYKKVVQQEDGSKEVYWSISTKKVLVKDPTRRPGKLKLTRTKVVEILKKLPEKDVLEVLEFTKHLAGKHIIG